MKPGDPSPANLRAGLRALLVQLVKQARRDLQKLPRHPEKAVHNIRARMKKFAAILRLVKKNIPRSMRKALQTSAKRIKGAFAAQREAHVAAVLSQKLGLKIPPGRKRKEPPLHDPIFVEVTRLEELLAGLRLPKLDRKHLRRAYIRSYRDGRHALKACLDDPSQENLHEWRKHVKRLYYESLALHAAGHGMNQRIHRSHRLGHLLGEEHDLHFMQNAAAQSRETSVVKKIKGRRESLRRKIFRIGRKLYDGKPGELDKRLR